MTLIDTHAHLYWDSYKEDLDQVIQRSIDAGVTTIINVGVDVELSKTAAKQAKEELSKISGLKAYSTIGIHPHDAIKYRTDVSIHKHIEELEQIYKTQPDQIVAVGECGLDFFFDNNSNHNPTSLTIQQQKDLQRKLFQAHIDLAKKLNLPLIVHCRDDRSKNPENTEAWDEVLEIVGTHPTILHCYSGLPKTTEKVLTSPALLVSFAGTITYPKNDYLRAAVKLLPLDRIVLETDCPFLPPQSSRGQRNEPSAVKEIAQLIAQLKGASLEEVADETTVNATKILRLHSG